MDAKPLEQVQPYYRNYCLAHGATSVDEMKRIAAQWPDPMTRPIFVLWIGRQWSEWRKERGVGEWDKITPEQRKDFGQWLDRKVGYTEVDASDIARDRTDEDDACSLRGTSSGMQRHTSRPAADDRLHGGRQAVLEAGHDRLEG